jgi:predicted small metal-binding protein
MAAGRDTQNTGHRDLGGIMKQLRCRDVGFDCDAVVEAESADEVMAQAGPHVKETHGMDVSPEMAQSISGSIRDV